MTRITLRAATTTADLECLAALADTIWREHYPPIIGTAQVDYMLDAGYRIDRLAAEQAAGTRFVIARQADRPVAFAAVSPDAGAPAVAWLDKLYVHAAIRRTGLGRRLVAWACEQARALEANALHLRVNRDNHSAIAAYRQVGFHTISEDIKPIGGGFVMDDYLMAKSLADSPTP